MAALATKVEYDFESEVDSSFIKRVVYNNKTRDLYVFFKGRQNPAGYRDVPPEAVKNLVDAYSVGSHYGDYIKDHYKGINTDGMVFVKAQTPRVKPAQNFDNYFGTQSAISSFNAVPKQTYKVVMVVEHEVEVDASDFNEAVRIAGQKYDKVVKVKGVNVVE